MNRKEMWLPKTSTKVTVTQDGTVTVWDEMQMELKPLPTRTGFSDRERSDPKTKLGTERQV